VSAGVALAFFDSAHGRYGIARSGATLLFEGSSATALEGGPEVERRDGGWRASLGEKAELDFEALRDPVELGGVKASVCRVSGTVEGTSIECLGTAGETATPPPWGELDAIRSISALFDEGNALLALARRPRGALGHGDELTVAWLIQEGEALGVEEARISTVYDGEGRQRSAGLELWLPGEEFPRRASGTVAAGSSLELEGLNVHAAVFRWRMEEREGLGAYELMVRHEPPSAA
jgi:hypothetical protein